MAVLCNSASPVIALVLSLSLLLQPLPVLSFSPKAAPTQQFEVSAVRSHATFVYIVLVKGNNTTKLSSDRHFYLSLLRHVAGASLEFAPRLLYVYKTLRGFAAKMTAEQAKNMSQAPGVVEVLVDDGGYHIDN